MPTAAQQTLLETSRRILEQMRGMYEDRLLDLDCVLRQAINLGRLEQEYGGSVRSFDPKLLWGPANDPDTPADCEAFMAYTDRLQEAEYAEKSKAFKGWAKEVRDSDHLPNLNSPKEDPGVGSPVGRGP